MRRSPMRGDRWREPLLRRLDRAAEKTNPFLLLIVIGLVVVNVACFIALNMATLQPPRHAESRVGEPPPTPYQLAVAGLPQS